MRRIRVFLLVGVCLGICGTVYAETETAADIDPDWLRGHERVGVTAGASTPDEVIDRVVLALDRAGKDN